MTNIGCMVARWVSHYLVCLALNWWSHPLRSTFPAPVPSTHSALFLRPPRGWLTFDGWQADGSHCRHGTSSAWFHSASPPPSNLVNNIKCWSSTEHVSVCEWLRHECCLFLLRLSLSRAHARNALAFIWLSSPSHMQAHFKSPYLPLISLVNLTRCESVRGRGCSSMLWMSSTSHMNWITGWAL